jgi:hypothetical protein
VNLEASLVIACDKRDAFAQGSASDEAIHVSASGEMDCFRLRQGFGGQVAYARNDVEKADP